MSILVHINTLIQLQRFLTHGLFCIIDRYCLGKEECGEANAADRELLRLLTPLVKLYTAKQVVPVVSEAIEATGALGYMEDSGFPNILRDAQVSSARLSSALLSDSSARGDW